MSLARDTREVKKWKAARRAQLALKQRFERIDWEEDVLNPEIDMLMAGRVRLEIEVDGGAAAESIVKMTIEGENDAAGSDEAV